ncbi:MAG: xanthine dehydrogenase family protein molybdopterin-binding subunit, partial [Burkholderiaceae bacterium]|nr:xanthine dehydrogenase family protein molybdopterin-binding subunit [Burkholderiaceae bacterium]
MSALQHVARFGSGREVPRVEDAALVRGRGRFVDDFSAPGQLHVVFARSLHAHARIRAIDTAAALAVPGVVAVITGAELVQAGLGTFGGPRGVTRADGQPAASPPARALAYEVVRYVGEPVAAIVAETKAAAKAGRDALLIDYEELPAVVDVKAAVAPGAPVLWPEAPDNVAAEIRHGDAAAVEQAFREAAHIVTLELTNQRLAAAPMEPRGALATLDGERLVLRLSSQMPSGARDTLAGILNIPKESVRVLVGDVGGGFGMKTGLYPEDVVVAYCARKLQRPVKWTAERSEEFLGALAGRDLVSHAELALDAQGKVLALRIRSLANVGAYALTTGVAIQLIIGPWVSTSVYDIPRVDEHIKAVLTNTTPTGAYRGAGRPENIYIIERLMDRAAHALGLPPEEIRRRNLIQPGQMPYRNAMGQTYDSGNFPALLAQCLPLADWEGFAARAEQSRARGRLRGRSVVTFLEWTSGNAFEERVTVTIAADGYVEIFTATQAMGQGIATSYAQLAVDVFDVPIDR